MGGETANHLRTLRFQLERDHAKSLLQTPGDWQCFTDILTDKALRRSTEDQAFAREYDARLREASQVILREELGLRPDQPMPMGADHAQGSSGRRAQAEARVLADHAARKAVFERDAMDALRDLTRLIRAGNAPAPDKDQTHTRSQDRSPKRGGPSRS